VKVLVSTTNGWNVGDDLIREGVLSIVGVTNEDVCFWLNRCVCKGGLLWAVQANSPVWEDVVRLSDYLLIAGSPDWSGKAIDDIYMLCVRFRTPVLVVGIGGMARRKNAFLEVAKAGLVRCCSVRDMSVYECLRFLRPEIFFDPAFHATYPERGKEYDVVLGYRAKGGNGAYTTEWDEIYERAFRTFGRRVSAVVVHEPQEYVMAEKLFDIPLFYSDDYLAYKDFYAKVRVYVGGRIHGAIATMSCGGFAHLLYDRPKKMAVEFVRDMVMEELGRPPCMVYPVSFVVPDIELEQPAGFKQLVDDDFSRHKSYVRKNGLRGDL